MIDGVVQISFTIHGDERGSLVAIESNKNIDFDIKRIYYIFGNNHDAVRGKHAHRSLKQVLVCVHGSCDILLDNGHEQETVTLSKPDEGIYITGFVWREMFHFSEDCVLLALVDHPYEPSDYTYDHQEVKQSWEEKHK